MKIQRSLKVLTLAIIASGFAVTSFGAVDCDSAYQACLKTPGHTGCQIAHKQCTDGQTVAPTPAIVPAAPAVNPAMAAANSSNSCDSDYNSCINKPGHTGCQKLRADCLANPAAQATPAATTVTTASPATPTVSINCDLVVNGVETIVVYPSAAACTEANGIPAAPEQHPQTMTPRTSTALVWCGGVKNNKCFFQKMTSAQCAANNGKANPIDLTKADVLKGMAAAANPNCAAALSTPKPLPSKATSDVGCIYRAPTGDYVFEIITRGDCMSASKHGTIIHQDQYQTAQATVAQRNGALGTMCLWTDQAGNLNLKEMRVSQCETIGGERIPRTQPTGNWCSWVGADGAYHLQQVNQTTCIANSGKYVENPAPGDLLSAISQMKTHNQSLNSKK
jgi:hypothetical protein